MSDQTTAAHLWDAAVALQRELPALHDDIVARWDEFSQLLEDGTEGGADGHPKRKAMYLAALAMQTDLMGRMVGLTDTTDALLERYAALDPAPELRLVGSAIERTPDLLKTLSPEAVTAFGNDYITMGMCVAAWQLTAASAMVAAFSGWAYFRDMIYAYLHQQTPLRGGFIAGVALIKHFAIDAATKGTPLLGAVFALAEVVKSNTERRIEEAAQARTEIDLIFSLEDAIADGISQVAEAEKIVRDAFEQLDQLEMTFNEAASRAHATLEMLAR